MGFLSDIVGAATGIIDLGTGGWASDQQTKASAKRQYNYNLNLMNENQAFQKYMAENAHQLEAADLQAAGYNPALTVKGSSASSIAGSSSPQGTSPGANGPGMSGIINDINNTRQTNANVDLAKANAKAALINANANATNAKTGAMVGKSTAKFNDERTRGTSRKGGNINLFGHEFGVNWEN